MFVSYFKYLLTFGDFTETHLKLKFVTFLKEIRVHQKKNIFQKSIDNRTLIQYNENILMDVPKRFYLVMSSDHRVINL